MESKQRWAQDVARLAQSADPGNVLGQLRRQAEESAGRCKGAKAELDAANDGVKRSWDALMEAQRRASLAEKEYIGAKLQARAPRCRLAPPPPAHRLQVNSAASPDCLVQAPSRIQPE
jgi:hypothetical protein